MDHEDVTISMRIMAIPAELAAIGAGIVLCAVVGSTNFLGTVFKNRINGNARGSVGVTVLADAVHAPCRIRDGPQSEGIRGGLVGHRIVMTVLAGIRGRESRSGIAGNVGARYCGPAVAG